MARPFRATLRVALPFRTPMGPFRVPEGQGRPNGRAQQGPVPMLGITLVATGSTACPAREGR